MSTRASAPLVGAHRPMGASLSFLPDIGLSEEARSPRRVS